MNVPTKTLKVVDHRRAGEIIREARLRAGMSQRELAKRLGFCAAHVHDLEYGNRNWTEELFQKAWEAVTE